MLHQVELLAEKNGWEIVVSEEEITDMLVSFTEVKPGMRSQLLGSEIISSGPTLRAGHLRPYMDKCLSTHGGERDLPYSACINNLKFDRFFLQQHFLAIISTL